MLEINNVENTKQTNARKKFIAYFGFLFVLAFLFFVPIALNYFIEYSVLDSIFFDIALLLLIISATLTLLVNIVYTSPLIYHLIKNIVKKNFSQRENDFDAIVNEQEKPTKRSYKIRRVLIWLFSISALGALFAYIIYLTILIFLST